MSILLEALRKTERQQRPAPTIHDEDPAGSAPEPVLGWPALAMMAVALLASGWAVWRQYEAPEGLYRPPVTLTAGQVSGAQSQVAADSGVEAATATRQPAVAPREAPAESQARPQRTPVESYQPPVADTTSSGPASSDRATNFPSAGDAASGSSAAAGRADHGAGVEAPTSGSGTAEAGGPHIPEPIGYWELPDAVRANVPEIRFTVLVYDEDPAGRFVLVSGERLGEGDELQPGLAVEEIRRDGVVFSYRLYRFFVGR